uniref:Ovule protein n=1 Tax=Panagrellus redivivus TaxID=6233 RepID=A0A7E4V5J6_PANRE
MDNLGSKQTSKEGNTTLHNEGFVCDFKQAQRTVVSQGTNASMDNLGSNQTSKDENTAIQNEGFVHVFKPRACVFIKCRAINRPLNQ